MGAVITNYPAVNGETIFAAMKIHDARYPKNDFMDRLNNTNVQHAVDFNRKLYPPKILIELVEDVRGADLAPTDARTLLEHYGFRVIPKP